VFAGLVPWRCGKTEDALVRVRHEEVQAYNTVSMVKAGGKIRIRWIRPTELGKVSRQFNRIFGFKPTYLVNLLRDEPNVYGPSNTRYSLAGFDGAKVVAHAAGRVGVVNIHGLSLPWSSYGNVFTDPAYRNRGIASRINRTIWGRLKSDGIEGVFISGGRGLYTRMGATVSGEYWNFSYSPLRWRALRAVRPVTVRQCTVQDAPLLVSLHAREAVGYLRAPQDFLPLLKHRKANHGPARTWVMMHGSVPLAYAVVGLHGRGARRRGAVIDYAGSRMALTAGLAQIAQRRNFRSLALPAAGWDRELLWMMRSMGRRGRWSPVGGTHLILNPARLVRRIQPYIASRIGASAAARLRFRPRSGGRYEFALGAQRHRYSSLAALTVLIMGGRPGQSSQWLPRSGTLRQALQRIFPLPFPIVGLNWM